jgi:hypothetical protein
MRQLRLAIRAERSALQATAITLFVLASFCVTQAQTRYEPNTPDAPNTPNSPLEPQPALEPQPVPVTTPQRGRRGRANTTTPQPVVFPGPGAPIEDYQSAVELLKKQVADSAAQRATLEAQLSVLQKQIEALKQQSNQTAMASEKVLKIHRLENIKAPKAAELLQQTMRGSLASIGVDEAGNNLIISADEKSLGLAVDILRAIDQPPTESRADLRAQTSVETLQIRLMWLAGDLPEGVGTIPDPRYFNADVIKSLSSIGLANPRVLCQQISSVVVRDDMPSNFSFQTPVTVSGNVIMFHGTGLISRAKTYQLELEASTAETHQSVLRDGGNHFRTRESKMGGSIALPVRHYVIIGATNLVVGNESDNNTLKSYPSGLVVYLDHVSQVAEDSSAPRMPDRAAAGRQSASSRDRRDEKQSANNPIGK